MLKFKKCCEMVFTIVPTLIYAFARYPGFYEGIMVWDFFLISKISNYIPINIETVIKSNAYIKNI